MPGSTSKLRQLCESRHTCVDVDARNADNLIPRDIIVQAKARIRWLEDIITTNLVNIDLSTGPQIEFDGADVLTQAEASISGSLANTQDPPLSRSPSTNKRPYASVDQDDAQQLFNSEARSVALDLGRLSLNADSREKHDLGSSSGLIFSYLTGTPPGATDESARANPRTDVVHASQNQRTFENLPPRDDALALLHIYVQNIHPDHPILHLGSILNALDSLCLCRDVANDTPVDQNDWPDGVPAFEYNGDIDMINAQLSTTISLSTAIFHCFMVLTLAATVKIGGTQNDFGPAPFYRAAKLVALDALSNTSIASLQGIYLFAVHALMAPAKLNIWTLSYVCTAHCIDSGIHRQQGQVSSLTKSTRSLVFYSIYSLDRMIATIQGRPLGIRDETFDIDLPALHSMQAEIESQALPPLLERSAKETARYTLHRFKLDRIVSEIKTSFYFLPGQLNPAVWSTDYVQQQTRIEDLLRSWHAEVCLIYETPDGRWRINLEQQYQAAVVLLYQPSQVIRQPSNEHLLHCYSAASRQIDCYNSLYDDLDTLHFDFRTVGSIFACGATIIYCFWTSKTLQASPQASSLPMIPRLCTTLLAVGAIWWPSVKKARSSFQRLVDLTLQRLSDVQKENLEHYRRKRPTIANTKASPDALSDRVHSRAGDPMVRRGSILHDSYPYYHKDVGVGFSAEQNQADGTTSDQWHVLESSNYVANDKHLLPSMDLEDPLSYGFTNISAHVEPEITSFLNDYFLDEAPWDLQEAGPPLTFRFGGL